MTQKKLLAVAVVGVLGLGTLGGLAFTAFESKDLVSSSAQVAQASKQPGTQPAQSQLEELSQMDAGSVETRLALAQGAFDAQEFSKAGSLFEKVYSLDPLNTEALHLAGKSFYLAGELNRARAIFDRVQLDAHMVTALYRARYAFADQEYDRALQLITSVTPEAQDESAFSLLTADILLVQNKIDASEEIYSKLTSDASYADHGRFGLAQIAQSRGDSEAARMQLDKIQLIKPQMQLHTAVADLYRQIGDAERAIQIYERLLETYGSRTPLLIAVAELIATTERAPELALLRAKITETSAYALAARHYIDAISAYLKKDFETALERLEFADRWFSPRDLYQLIRVDSAMKTGAQAQFDQAVIALSPNQLSQERRDYLYGQMTIQASDWLNRGQAQFGKSLAETALILRSDNDAAGLLLARAHLLLGEYPAARDRAVALLESSEFSAGALEVGARASIELGDTVTALNLLDQLESLQSEAPVAHYWRGVALLRSGEEAAAERAFITASELGGRLKAGAALVDLYMAQERWDEIARLGEEFTTHESTTVQGVGFAFKAGSERGQNRLDQAAKLYERAFEVDETRFVYLLSAFDLWIDNESYAEARRVLTQMKTARPDDLIVGFKSAYFHQLSGARDQAIAEYRALLLESPNWASVLVNLSEALGENAADLPEAVRLAEQAVNARPDWAPASANLARLTEAKLQLEGQSTVSNIPSPQLESGVDQQLTGVQG